MLRVVVYDIACPRRLKRVAELCLDHGVRVQKSVFECWLDDERFNQFWEQLHQKIDRQEDRLLAYTLDANAGRSRRHAGDLAVVSEKRSHYVL